ncbi:hypothetical protein N9W34_06540 [Rickettsiales bacterium]|nr:hypothetical protein [Rickettsiales bacterium]
MSRSNSESKQIQSFKADTMSEIEYMVKLDLVRRSQFGYFMAEYNMWANSQWFYSYFPDGTAVQEAYPNRIDWIDMPEVYRDWYNLQFESRKLELDLLYMNGYFLGTSFYRQHKLVFDSQRVVFQPQEEVNQASINMPGLEERSIRHKNRKKVHACEDEKNNDVRSSSSRKKVRRDKKAGRESSSDQSYASKKVLKRGRDVLDETYGVEGRQYEVEIGQNNGLEYQQAEVASSQQDYNPVGQMSGNGKDCDSLEVKTIGSFDSSKDLKIDEKELHNVEKYGAIGAERRKSSDSDAGQPALVALGPVQQILSQKGSGFVDLLESRGSIQRQ